MVTGEPTKVFVSYAAEDADTAEMVVATLRDAGFEPVYMGKDKFLGEVFKSVYERLAECAVVVAVVSDAMGAATLGTEDNEKNWIVRELIDAETYGLPIVPYSAYGGPELLGQLFREKRIAIALRFLAALTVTDNPGQLVRHVQAHAATIGSRPVAGSVGSARSTIQRLPQPAQEFDSERLAASTVIGLAAVGAVGYPKLRLLTLAGDWITTSRMESPRTSMRSGEALGFKAEFGALSADGDCIAVSGPGHLVIVSIPELQIVARHHTASNVRFLAPHRHGDHVHVIRSDASGVERWRVSGTECRRLEGPNLASEPAKSAVQTEDGAQNWAVVLGDGRLQASGVLANAYTEGLMDQDEQLEWIDLDLQTAWWSPERRRLAGLYRRGAKSHLLLVKGDAGGWRSRSHWSIPDWSPSRVIIERSIASSGRDSYVLLADDSRIRRWSWSALFDDDLGPANATSP